MPNVRRKKAMTLYLPERMFKIVETIAKQTNESKTGICEKAIAFGLDKLIDLYKIDLKI
jgi:predicted transcriptional regulator